MKIITSKILSGQKNLVFGFSTKYHGERKNPFYFNMSFSVGDDNKRVRDNREEFYSQIGLTASNIAYQKQIHSDIITIVNKGGFAGESDALITNMKQLGLAVSSADCSAIFIYDNKEKVIAGVHSGWRGTVKKILTKTLNILIEKYQSKPKNLIVYLSPSISQNNYEVGLEVAEQFNSKYWKKNGSKFFLDVAKANYDMLLNFGIHKKNIEISQLCSYNTDYLHSYRRDGKMSGRALGVISMKN